MSAGAEHAFGRSDEVFRQVRRALYSIFVETAPPGESPGIRYPATASPFATIYASPLPFRTWNRLVRAGFSTGPSPGRSARLSRCLEDLDLYARSFHTAEIGQSGDSRPFGTDTHAILEFPRAEFSTDTQGGLQIAPANLDLHQTLLQLMNGGREGVGACEAAIRRQLTAWSKKHDVVPALELRGIYPLRAVNHLAELNLKPQNLTIREHSGSFARALSCKPWRGLLWPEERATFESAASGRTEPIVVVASVDPEEQLITLYLYRSCDKLIASFDLGIPAAGMEHRWWRWIYEEVGAAGGDVIGSRSTARRDGRWGTLSLVVAFPLNREAGADNVSDVSRIVNCFRCLKGRTALGLGADSPRFGELLTDLGPSLDGRNGEKAPRQSKRHRAIYHGLGAASAADQVEKQPRTDSTLHNVRLWYWHEQPVSSRYERRFGLNPFLFTRPMDLHHYARLYYSKTAHSSPTELNSRVRLTGRLVEHLTNQRSENVILVGAYRSGKTTTMNMVVDLLNGVTSHAHRLGLEQTSLRPVLAVRVSAALTPPEMLFMEVFRGICSLAERTDIKVGPLQRSWASKVADAALRLAENFSENINLEMEFAVPLITSLKIALGHGTTDERRASRDSPAREADRAGFLRTSVKLLQLLLSDVSRKTKETEVRTPPGIGLSQQASNRFADEKLRVVVALDEVTDSAEWGGKWAFPAWRQMLEDSEDGDIAWMFSSTGPLASAVDYSPLGNALREYNMAPLELGEAAAMVRAIEIGAGYTDVPDAERLRPTVTYGAERLICHLTGRQPYLMQVVCCLVFEDCIRHEVPVVTSRVVTKIVRRSVLAELSDYFQGQWQKLPGRVNAEDTTKGFLLMKIRERRADPWSTEVWDRSYTPSFPPEVQKALERAGLRGPETHTELVPLFVMWLDEHFGSARQATPSQSHRQLSGRP